MPETLDRSRTPLLTLITQEALDRDYQVAASRAAATAATATGVEGERGPRHGYRVGVVVVVGLFAMLVTVAGVQTSQNADVDDASRASLIDRIEARRATVRRLQNELAALRAANADAEDRLRSLGNRVGDLQARRSRLGALTGFSPVTGSGVRVRVDNPPYAGPNEQLRDSDLALLVDGLWAAGAEAISINGQRVNAHGGITNVGEAIEVNGFGIAPPFTVLAIGDRRTLASRFAETQAGLRFLALARQYGFEQKMDNVDDLHLPAAPGALLRLRSAEQEKTKPQGQQGGDGP
ncbi:MULTISPECIES: DUF881 domain-containing protein [unclassified Nocardioides]|uniref:DUF881 domain-containing protein n=1 Tax=unclassified Nocardioides TaxID=2615069 RepID=UPI0011534B46|nr:MULTISPECIES: DUF881 domain-containing protein [unclassified Nocardioides]TQK71211.1 uncharacterized protein YlxW (UPF0749 family) [Nocardioides sp. SLBN-35]WGY04622.1 DUF881 domain-containing protein [Nocardioides sp. QY071]